jgi:hypothetical protein
MNLQAPGTGENLDRVGFRFVRRDNFPGGNAPGRSQEEEQHKVVTENALLLTWSRVVRDTELESSEKRHPMRVA